MLIPKRAEFQNLARLKLLLLILELGPIQGDSQLLF